MEKGRKKSYQKPSIVNIFIDREVGLMLTSNDTLPGGGGGFNVSSNETTSSDNESTSSTKQNSFDENPFER